MDIFSSAFNLALIIFGFGVLIFFHELGHFVAAKWAGIRTEAFAVGMGPVVASWRKGIGVCLGSSRRRVHERVKAQVADDESMRRPDEGIDDAVNRLSETDYHRVADGLGIGETEYSLRWLPLGGFVKMLGQEDANPAAVSDDPRSYNMCPIGKRMVVVSAGVIMNVLLALVMFIIAFQIGVRFEAPVVGDISTTLAAGTTMPDNAAALGITDPGLKPGDRVTSIDGKPARTFADLQIASAMSKADQVVHLQVQRDGYDLPLQFSLTPRKDATSGLLSVGVAPGSTSRLVTTDPADIEVSDLIEELGLLESGVRLGMQLTTVAGRPVSTYEQFQAVVADTGGEFIDTTWRSVDETGDLVGPVINASVPVSPQYEALLYPELSADGKRDFEFGLLGVTPLTSITAVDLTSPNKDMLQVGDVILRVDTIHGPRLQDFRHHVMEAAGETVALELLRGEAVHTFDLKVNRKGRLGIAVGYAWELPLIAEPLDRIAVLETGESAPVPRATPVASLGLLPRTRLDAVHDTPVTDWPSFRKALRRHTVDAVAAGTDATVSLTVINPTSGQQRETMTMALTAEQVSDLHGLSWSSDLPPYLFEPIYTTLSSNGNPITAIAMGMGETHKIIMLTYLTIDRLVRGTVGVEQLRGPVGIMHIGTKVADRGLMYLLFFLAMISVNLAVINFLPLPIVDGGLFLFLIYEKLKGRPPSIAFQNAATIVGLFLIGTIFLVTLYNDVLRLIT